jgi:choline dehydrogenase
MSDEYDYIIVGSGAGGSTLAYRLAEARLGTILVIENGPDDSDPMHHVPKGFFLTLNGDRYTYQYGTEKVPGTNKTETWLRGKVVGGSTTVNGMIYSRGGAPDFDAFAKHVRSEHWGWERVLAAYRAMEDHDLGESPMRGVGGRLGISADGPHDELANRVFAAGEAVGWRRVADINESDDERIGYTPSTVKNGRRTSAASAFLRPALRDGKVHLLTGTWVTKVLIRDGRAYGVQALRARIGAAFHARREVIVAAGTIESPLLLERSGIGRPDVLNRLGVDVVVESPHVGERVIEHRMVIVQARLDRGLGITDSLGRLLAQGLPSADEHAGAGGLLATSGYDFTFHCKSDPSLERPDLVGAVAPYAIDPAAGRLKLADHAGMIMAMYQKRPGTTGSVHASGTGPEAPPVITARYLDTPTDVAVVSRILGKMRAYLAAVPLADVIAGEDFPTSAVPDDPETAVDYARRFGAEASHAVGSCAMGPEDDDVVDAHLRVRGVAGLRVVDASVLPMQVSGNTAAPVMAVAWLAGDLIAEA